jgi:hypothetical protein
MVLIIIRRRAVAYRPLNLRTEFRGLTRCFFPPDQLSKRLCSGLTDEQSLISAARQGPRFLDQNRGQNFVR